MPAPRWVRPGEPVGRSSRRRLRCRPRLICCPRCRPRRASSPSHGKSAISVLRDEAESAARSLGYRLPRAPN